MDRCHRCGSARIHISRLRSPLEHVRAALSGQVPVRCHVCDHRAWTADPPVVIRVKHEAALSGPPAGGAPAHAGQPVTNDDLDRLDPNG